MCEPTTIMAITTVAATAANAYIQVQQGQYEAGVSKYNARVAENRAEEVRRAGTEEEMAHRRKVAQLQSTQRAQLGAAGVELGSGSALQLQEDTLAMGEADALRIRSNVESQVGALQTQADLTRSQGSLSQYSAGFAAGGTILSGTAATLGTGVADKWFTPNSAAVKSSYKN